MEPRELYMKTGRAILGSVESQLFGKPCFKINGKPFIAFFENCMVFKLTGDAHRDTLGLDGTQLFDPSKKNRPMKEWIQVPFQYSGQWVKLAGEAVEYVRQLPEK